ncbi:serine/threonine-protein kinase [Paludisphaera soli]|uniref:serine/threonine-protein kinase n=1 Tax=Paludisphaera soli TaxID=2712865 RepID=UPI0013ED1FAE|nr:serine/threonine-protein kinase [Paludisphaera soli]
MTERSLFLAALEIPDPTARAAYLDETCGADPKLRARIEELLSAHAETGSFMARPAAEQSPEGTIPGLPPGASAGPSLVGLQLDGRYVLGEEIGRGGMGTVHRAEQLRPVKRTVAVKLVGAGMDSRHILNRFEAERQALALMDHPNIARVLDAGATPDGRPFFVMELVDGVPLTTYCDRRRLPVADRLDLFRRICRAVQHAHQKGIIHRDLKPSNVLIEDQGGKPTPKVIDFGLAKAVGGTVLTDETLPTLHGTFAGSPLYMAPEQAGPDAGDVDVRADVYALGAMLYELLSGSTPIPRDVLKQAALAQVVRLIREDEPPAPSRRLGESDALPSVAVNRRTEPGRLGRLIRGDLDWVALKALEKDRDRRYESAAAFADDVERFLNHEPVSAGPPTAAYRARKFVRRNRSAVVAAALVFLALVAGVVGTTLGLLEARRHAALTEAERLRADAEAAVAREVNAILTRGLLGQADPNAQATAGRAPDPDLKVRTLLDAVAAGLDGRFADRPAVEAAVRLTVGKAYQGLGVYPESIRHLERALQLAEAAAPPPAAETVETADELATAYRRGGRHEEAGRLNRRYLDLLEPALGPDDPRVLTFVYNLGVVAMALGHPEEAESRFIRALEGREKALGKDSFLVAQARTALGNAAGDLNDDERSLSLHEQALPVFRRVLSETAPDTMIVANNRANALSKLGRTDEAIEAFTKLVDDARRHLGPTHVDTLTYIDGLANCRLDQERYDLAEPLLREALDAARATLPPEHPDVVHYAYQIGCLYESTRRHVEADRELAEALRLSRLAYPAGHPMTVRIAQHLIDVRFAADRHADAEPLVRELLALNEGRDPNHWVVFHLRGLLGRAALAQGRHADAEPLLLDGYRGLKERQDKLPPPIRARMDELPGRLAELYVGLGKPDEAAKWRGLQKP